MINTETPILIPGSVIKDKGIPSQKGTSIVKIEISKSQFKNWDSMNYIYIDGAIPNGPNLYTYHKYYSNFDLRMEIGMQIQFDFNVSDSTAIK